MSGFQSNKGFFSAQFKSIIINYRHRMQVSCEVDSKVRVHPDKNNSVLSHELSRIVLSCNFGIRHCIATGLSKSIEFKNTKQTSLVSFSSIPVVVMRDKRLRGDLSPVWIVIYSCRAVGYSSCFFLRSSGVICCQILT